MINCNLKINMAPFASDAFASYALILAKDPIGMWFDPDYRKTKINQEFLLLLRPGGS